MSSVSGPIAPPTEAQKLRLRELKDETAKAVAVLNALLDGSIKRINEKLSGQPHVMTGVSVQ